jgi:L-serine kinase (ATP) / ParB family transcriptional regulator, heme-responsive regulator
MSFTIAYRYPGSGSGGRKEQLDIPDLRVVPTDSLLLHEHADEKRVARLETRVREDGFLKNPPIVAPIPGTDRYVVLDGANRTSAMMRIGCPHLLVQLVEYNVDQVRLLTWHHLITGREPVTFMQEISKVQGLTLQPATLEQARRALAQHSILAYIVLPPGSEPLVCMVDGTPGTDHHGTNASTALLNAMVDTYKSDPQVTIHRSGTDELEDLMSYYDKVSGLIVFPPYKPEDIVKLAEAGTYVPTGITRHIISHRALRVNVPLTFLCGSQSLEDKNAWWHEQVKAKLAANEIRLYQESTYLFDE